MKTEHPARRAAHDACRKISAQVRREFPDAEYVHGRWCGPQWKQAEARDTELRNAPDFLALKEAAARAPFFA